jgi:hypothetical protein
MDDGNSSLTLEDIEQKSPHSPCPEPDLLSVQSELAYISPKALMRTTQWTRFLQRNTTVFFTLVAV